MQGTTSLFCLEFHTGDATQVFLPAYRTIRPIASVIRLCITSSGCDASRVAELSPRFLLVCDPDHDGDRQRGWLQQAVAGILRSLPQTPVRFYSADDGLGRGWTQALGPRRRRPQCIPLLELDERLRRYHSYLCRPVR